MSTTETVRAWATTNAGNAAADAAISSSDAQSPDTIDNNIRSVMAAVKKQMNDIGGSLVAGGTANALTVTTGQVLESGQITDGLRLLLKATADNTSTTVTFAPDGLTAANIKRADGSALAVGSIKSGMYLDLVYNSGSSEWRCASIALAQFGSEKAAFHATKNSVDQTGIGSGSTTKVTFTTEAFDVGSFYDNTNSKWTPPAGTIQLIAAIDVTASVVDQSSYSLFLYKNGAIFKQSTIFASGASACLVLITAIDQAVGTDYYEVYVNFAGTGNKTISGVASVSYFQGHMI